MKKITLNISNEEREKISLGLKVVTYFFVLVWDLVFLSVSYWLYIIYLHPYFPQGGFYVLFRPWYIITAVLIGIWVAAHNFQRIGKWEYPVKVDKPKK